MEADFEKIFRYKRDCVDNRIKRYLPLAEGYQKNIIDAMNYSVIAGGKRLRPIMLIESYLMFDGKMGAIYAEIDDCVAKFASALECIHTYSLVHDDLPAMDNDKYRRGLLTTHSKFGEAAGILAGDGLLNYAFELIFSAMSCSQGKIDDNNDTFNYTGKVKISDMINAADYIAKASGYRGMLGGQAVDVEMAGHSANMDILKFMHEKKTGALIKAAFAGGALLAGADVKNVEKIEMAAGDIGLAFQIRDDILDVTGSLETLGKTAHKDEKEDKTTYVSMTGVDEAEKKVIELSMEASELLKELGAGSFLISLAEYLTLRNS